MTTAPAARSNAPSVTTWRWVAAVLAVSQLVASPVSRAVNGEFLKSGATNQALITPAGYAFSLWGLITLLSSVTAVAIVRYGLGSPWETDALIDASVVFVGFSVWLTVAAQDWLWASVVVFIVMAAALAHIMWLLVRHREELTCPRWLAVLATVSFGLYLGWSSIAVFANVTAALIAAGWSASGAGWQLAVLLAASLTAVVATVLLRGTPGYVAGVLWALVAIAIGASQRDSAMLSMTAVVAAVAVAAVAVWQQVRARTR
ncbi:hypothetical protein [Mycolicibacterium litorale]|uniref:Uncharacterized protein n=1 Tax=Mycolicibacterium litorale TaxID=758802 RepID=A0AAD1MSZ0_9MYCO|nr:hypothetical protein [Mycolicibacterium litorale]MCV7416484.1 hypothetical protein [Mycolicibacterium litorale]TDY09738.1 hypothetical protein BCL50_1835 [Mycolicibacterium litorale]BBY17684.1 hypothetical protein MLIT_32760 [Mycolicibacterium litorale]